MFNSKMKNYIAQMGEEKKLEPNSRTQLYFEIREK